MPIAQYRYDAKGIFKSATVPVPKKVSDVAHWYKAVAKAIREIPPVNSAAHVITYPIIEGHRIVVRIYHREPGNYSYIFIDRTKNSLGY